MIFYEKKNPRKKLHVRLKCPKSSKELSRLCPNYGPGPGPKNTAEKSCNLLIDPGPKVKDTIQQVLKVIKNIPQEN